MARIIDPPPKMETVEDIRLYLMTLAEQLTGALNELEGMNYKEDKQLVRDVVSKANETRRTVVFGRLGTFVLDKEVLT